MKSCFKSPIVITQLFGKEFMYHGEPYYASYGLKGHNGLDVKPSDVDWSIYNILSGKIIILEFNKTYGNRVGIWNEEKKLVEVHNHLEFYNPALKMGLVIESKTFVGKMDTTGFSLGAHNHYAMYQTDEKGNRINLDNGYKGWIDPLPFLKE